MFVLKVEGSSEVRQGFVGIILEAGEFVVDEDCEEVFLDIVLLTCS